ncbi:MAG: hypothetical protein HYV27_04670 [Candidatus Hydrogenedentes bacterium]|nr:hypothetical protein [Candidatus Hydrogenedentota bacterium]
MRYSFVLLVACLLSACGADRSEITEVRERSADRTLEDTSALSGADRLGLNRPQAATGQNPHGDMGMMGEAGANEYHWDTPATWTELAPNAMRLANLQVTGQPDTECYFTALPGEAGGIDANLNRWRQQMGLADYTADEIAALPRKKLLGQEAIFASFDGTYGGMRGDVKLDGYRMLGMILIADAKAYFAKMTGPAAVLANEEANFLAFCESLHKGDSHGAGAPADAVHGAAPAPEAAAAGAPAFHWTAPEGWVDAGANSMRLANLKVSSNPEIECYFTMLPGGGGGVDANLNRWRKQMGLGDYTPEELAALPKHALLGQEGVFAKLDGAYGGMRGDVQLAGYRMLGVIATAGDQAFFVKMTGPAAALEAEEANFLAFCDSIHSAEGHDHGTAGAAPAAPPAVPMAELAPGQMTWTAPAAWVQAPEKMMRVVTYTMGAQNEAECYISVLAGTGGGAEANINRWFAQVGQPPLTPEAIEALPKIAMMGQESLFVDVSGDFQGMSATEKQSNYRLLGVVCMLDGQSVFVKMTGPAEVVEAEKENFLAFCSSLQ